MIRPITLLTLALVSAGLVSAQSTLPTAPGPQLLSSLQQPQAMASPAAAQTPPRVTLSEYEAFPDGM
ncbi:MAG: hypothetical protein WCB76_06990, partial [Acidobacteriaceae bacterium]